MKTGSFIAQGNNFIAGKQKLCIKQRKKHSEKPLFYLIAVQPFQYVSSLFPVSTTEPGEKFTFDFENKLYSLRRYENLIEIKEIP